MQYRFSHHLGRIDRLGQLRLVREIVSRVLDEERVDSRGLDERDGDRRTIVFHLDAQRIGIALDGMFRRDGCPCSGMAPSESSLPGLIKAPPCSRRCFNALSEPFTMPQKFVSKSLR
ncbi:hypothetical protein [Caballeronia temeraria]|uniref:hypothetical protein n=1 Tax=Caballeronia temeraria TaxID=1777137 RepID=UPI001FC9AF47|nr:hypothetical protein [Caballeronia temeraria]